MALHESFELLLFAVNTQELYPELQNIRRESAEISENERGSYFRKRILLWLSRAANLYRKKVDTYARFSRETYDIVSLDLTEQFLSELKINPRAYAG